MIAPEVLERVADALDTDHPDGSLFFRRGKTIRAADLRAILAYVSECQEALEPFGRVRTNNLEDKRYASVNVCFSREEALAFNEQIEAESLPITKADVEAGTHFPSHLISLDGLCVGDFRRAARLSPSDKAKGA